MNKESRLQEAYLSRLEKQRRKIMAARILLALAFFLLWETAADRGWIDSFFFSSPSRLGRLFLSMWRDGSLFLHVGITLTETLVSFALVVVIGLAVSLLLWLSDSVFQVLEPYLVILNSLPKSALAPLLIVWLGANSRTIIVAGMSVAIFRNDPESLHRLYGDQPREDPSHLHPSRHKKRRPHEGRPSFYGSDDHQHHEG